jgi:hypothetical protein
MQKVEGSNPFSRSQKSPHLRSFLTLGALARTARFEGSAKSGFSPETPCGDVRALHHRHVSQAASARNQGGSRRSFAADGAAPGRPHHKEERDEHGAEGTLRLLPLSVACHRDRRLELRAVSFALGKPRFVPGPSLFACGTGSEPCLAGPGEARAANRALPGPERAVYGR